MIEYTRKDIIMDPNDPRLEGAIGKKVYSSSDINLLLNRANNDEYEMTLIQIEDVDSEPFTVMNTDGTEYDADFIIIKKKEKSKPKYVPFKNITEFLDAYGSAPGCLNEEAYFLSNHGMWLKDTDRDVYCSVTEIWNYGVVVGDSNMNTTKDGDEYFTMNGVTEWKQLFREYTFLDGSPCGKEVK